MPVCTIINVCLRTFQCVCYFVQIKAGMFFKEIVDSKQLSNTIKAQLWVENIESIAFHLSKTMCLLWIRLSWQFQDVQMCNSPS